MKNLYTTKQAIIREIKRRKDNSFALNAETVFNADSSLYRHAIKEFGSWREALQQVGLRYEDRVTV